MGQANTFYHVSLVLTDEGLRERFEVWAESLPQKNVIEKDLDLGSVLLDGTAYSVDEMKDMLSGFTEDEVSLGTAEPDTGGASLVLEAHIPRDSSEAPFLDEIPLSTEEKKQDSGDIVSAGTSEPSTPAEDPAAPPVSPAGHTSPFIPFPEQPVEKDLVPATQSTSSVREAAPEETDVIEVDSYKIGFNYSVGKVLDKINPTPNNIAFDLVPSQADLVEEIKRPFDIPEDASDQVRNQASGYMDEITTHLMSKSDNLALALNEDLSAEVQELADFAKTLSSYPSFEAALEAYKKGSESVESVVADKYNDYERRLVSFIREKMMEYIHKLEADEAAWRQEHPLSSVEDEVEAYLSQALPQIKSIQDEVIAARMIAQQDLVLSAAMTGALDPKKSSLIAVLSAAALKSSKEGLLVQAQARSRISSAPALQQGSSEIQPEPQIAPAGDTQELPVETGDNSNQDAEETSQPIEFVEDETPEAEEYIDESDGFGFGGTTEAEIAAALSGENLSGEEAVDKGSKKKDKEAKPEKEKKAKKSKEDKKPGLWQSHKLIVIAVIVAVLIVLSGIGITVYNNHTAAQPTQSVDITDLPTSTQAIAKKVMAAFPVGGTAYTVTDPEGNEVSVKTVRWTKNGGVAKATDSDDKFSIPWSQYEAILNEKSKADK